MTTPNEIETPRTDEKIKSIDDSDIETSEGCYACLADFARTLERENAQLRKDRDDAQNAHRIQRENYMELYDAVMGEGYITSDWHDIIAIAKRHRESASLAQTNWKMAEELEYFSSHGSLCEIRLHPLEHGAICDCGLTDTLSRFQTLKQQQPK